MVARELKAPTTVINAGKADLPLSKEPVSIPVGQIKQDASPPKQFIQKQDDTPDDSDSGVDLDEFGSDPSKSGSL